MVVPCTFFTFCFNDPATTETYTYRHTPSLHCSLPISRASDATRARLDREAAKRDITAALDADLADHRMHHEQLGNARSRLVPLAKKRAELDLASYAAGKLDLGTALLSTLALVEAEVDALAREAEVARDAIRINYIYGETGR